MSPEAVITPETPFAGLGASNEERPALAAGQVGNADAMLIRGTAVLDVPCLVEGATVGCLFPIVALEQDRDRCERVVMQSPIVVIVGEVVEKDIEESILRDQPPAGEIDTVSAVKNQVWFSRTCPEEVQEPKQKSLPHGFYLPLQGSCGGGI